MGTAARRRTTGTHARAALLAAVVVTVAGLLGMHALSLHGTGTDGEHGALSLPAAHIDHAHALDHTDPADHGAADPAGHPDSGGHTAMTLCAAFLLAAGVLLLAGLWRRTSAWRLPRSVSSPRTTGRVRAITRPATGPPPEWAFSVIRC